jgi:alcohol dehydrogenase (cytochrome c)
MLLATTAQGQARESRDQAGKAYLAAGSELTPRNIDRMQLAATFRTGHPGRVTEAPLIQDHLLFLLTAFPHTLYALDLTHPGLPIKWQFRPDEDSAALGYICCGKS